MSAKKKKKTTSAVPPVSTPKKPRAVPWARFMPYGVIVGLTAVFYWPVLTAQGWFWNDFPEQNFIYRLFAAVNLKQGVFPFWNPYVFSGMPFFADVQAAVLYPLNLLLTPFASAEWLSPLLVEYQIIAHIALAGIFMYWLSIDFGCTRSGGVLAAMTFMFCGFLTAHIFHTNLIQTAAWFPLVVLLCRRMLEGRSLIYLALCALTLASAFLAGYPQTMLHMYYWLAAFLLFAVFVKQKGAATGARAKSVQAGMFAVMAGLSISLASVQLLPTGELGEQSARPSMEFRESCEGSVYPYRLVTYLVPNFFGTPDGVYWGIAANDERGGVHNYWETAVYNGVVPLLLALFAAFFVRTPLSLFLSIMAGLAFLLSLGDAFFLYKLFHTLLPGMDRFRVPGRFAFIMSFSIALLAGFGLQVLTSNSWHNRDKWKKILPRAVLGVLAVSIAAVLIVSAGALKGGIAAFMLSSGVFGSNGPAIAQYVDTKIYPALVGACWLFALFAATGCALIALRLAGKISARMTVIGLLSVAAFDLLIYGYGYAAQGNDPNKVYEKTPAVRALQEQLSQEFFRINSRDSKPGTTDLGGRNMLFAKNQGSVHRLFLMEGYNPLRLKHQIAERNRHALDILNVKYMIAVDSASGTAGFALNPTWFPRARMVYNYSIIPEDERVLPLLWSPSFDHRSTVILEREPLVAPCDTCDSLNGKAAITRYGLNEIDIAVETGQAGLLVLSEIHYPCWKARVDGKHAPLYRADYALRAVPVSAGTHTVTCFYDDATFRKGRTITLVSLFVLIGLLAAGIGRHVRSRRVQS
ncbi:MAG: YfhO family protein [Chitinispirillaceae bacterium]|nr:YfhO family protein [Chitinispirillaceae bacterium]